MILKISRFYRGFYKGVNTSHLKAYAAKAAFFLFLSMVPGILMLLTLIQFTPVTEADIITAVNGIFPTEINVLIVNVVQEVYSKSKTTIPVTALVAMWSASRGVLSIASGLNWIYKTNVKRNYLYMRLRSTVYTFFFFLAIVLSLVLLVFGNMISAFATSNFPLLGNIIEFIVSIRVLLATAVLTVVFMVAYKVLPDKKNIAIKEQFPGALFSAIGWVIYSFALSIYVDVYGGLTNMYGSMATIVLVMLWVYFCMYIMLLGARLNVYLREDSIVEVD